MKPKMLLLISLAYYITVGSPNSICAESPLVDPNIPNGETITYTSHLGDKQMKIVESVMVKREGGKELYQITSRSKSLDRTIILAKETMAILSVHTARKHQEVTLDLKLSVIDEKPHFEKDKITLADISVQKYVLRGFPFEKLKKLKIGYYREDRKKKFPFKVECKEKENIKVNQQAIECYKLEISMDGFWGKFVPKTKIWYSAKPPHYLVRYEGPGGPPGSPKRTMELVTYTVMESSG